MVLDFQRKSCSCGSYIVWSLALHCASDPNSCPSPVLLGPARRYITDIVLVASPAESSQVADGLVLVVADNAETAVAAGMNFVALAARVLERAAATYWAHSSEAHMPLADLL